jgi:hypothetical protein
MDIPEVRRRVRAGIERARRDAAERRARTDVASRAYDEFLTAQAIPAFNLLAAALVGEGVRVKVFTPAGSVRLSSERSADDFVELTLDTTEDPPVVLVRSNVGRGRRAVTKERPLHPGVPIPELTQAQVVDFVIEELLPLVAR